MLPSLLLAVVLAQSSTFVVIQEPESRAWLTHAAIAAHVVAQGVDLSTTSYAMGRGGFRESNPLMRPFAGDPVRLAVVKGVYATGTSYLLLKLHRSRPKTAFVVAAVSAVCTSIVAARNARLVRPKG